MPPSTVYKGDLTEISFGHESGLVLTYDSITSFTFTHTSTDASANTSLITLAGGAASMPIASGGDPQIPRGMLVGVKMTIIGTNAFTADDNAATGKTFTVVSNNEDTENTITVTPALSTATSAVSAGSDTLVFHPYKFPSIDVNMAYHDNANQTSESSLLDQFLGITTAITLPETRVDLKRYHVVGLGRDVSVQVPGRFINEGGSFEVNMHNPRWLYYCLGMESVIVGESTYDVKDADEAMLTSASLESSGVDVNETNFGAGTQTVITVDSVDATTKFKVGDAVFHSNAFAGTIEAVTATTITLETANVMAINEDVDLQRAKTRTTEALSAGASIISYANGGAIPIFQEGTSTVTAGDYVIIKDLNLESITSFKEGDQTAFGLIRDSESDPAINVGTTRATYFDRTTKSEIRRIVAITATKIWLDDPLCYSHESDIVLRFAKFDAAALYGSPNRASTGALTNGVTRLLYSRSHVPSFAMEVSIRRRDNQADDGTTAEVVDGGTSDSKQLTRVFRGCKVKEFSLTADTDAALRLTVGFDSALCYTDTGRLEASNKGDRYNPHRVFEDTASTDVDRKKAGIAVGTQKPYMFYNGTITLAGVQIGQVVSFTVTGTTGVQQFYTINGAPITDATTDQTPFAGARNASIAVEGQTEYMMDMEIIVDDPVFYHKMRRAVDHDATTANMIRLSFTKAGTAAGRETLDIYLDDYVITEAPLPIPEDKGPLRAPLKVMPKAMRVISTDTLFHC